MTVGPSYSTCVLIVDKRRYARKSNILDLRPIPQRNRTSTQVEYIQIVSSFLYCLPILYSWCILMSLYREPGRALYLNLQTMKRLDRMIVRSYADWIADAPQEYQDEELFTNGVPVAITSRFGQNQELARTLDLHQEEQDNWARDRDYTRIRYLTIALASHIRYAPFVVSILRSLPFTLICLPHH